MSRYENLFKEAEEKLNKVVARHKKAGSYPTSQEISEAIRGANSDFKNYTLYLLHLYKKEQLHKAKTPAEAFNDILSIIETSA